MTLVAANPSPLRGVFYAHGTGAIVDRLPISFLIAKPSAGE